MNNRKANNWWENRLAVMMVIIVFFAALLLAKLALMQLWQHDDYLARAEGQHQTSEKLTPKRGEIFLQDYKEPQHYYPFATNRKFYLVYANTNEVKYPHDTMDKLAAIFNIAEDDQESRDILLGRLIKSNDIYEPLQNKVTEEQRLQLDELALPGIYYNDEVMRYYPEGRVGSQVVGFVGYTDDGYQGQYGLEGYFNKELSGQSGYLSSDVDGIGRIIATAERNYKRAENGFDLILTIDRAIQFHTCSLLQKDVLKYGAESGTVIIMDPNTGAIMAMCSYPDFDPNIYNKVESMSVYNNPAIFEAYEPGSVFKAITMAAGLDMGLLTPETTFEDTGEVKIADYTIRNAENKKYGKQNMTQVLEKSINTGAIWVAQQVGNQKWRDYVENFGFGQPTGISLDSEVAGNISALNKRGEIYLATSSYGQGITATPIQLVTAFGAIANGGKLVKPYIVDKVKFSSGLEEQNQPTVVRQVISSKTSITLAAMLGSVVESGHAQSAGVDGYYIAGKTGTAQSVISGGEYDKTKTVHTFVGFAPLASPRFVMLTKFDHPTNVEFAASSAAPLFGEIAKYLLNYLQIPVEK
ncbi:MAG: peptidoglycan D,D-transpeptidase FtsI family protein [Candidatus Komeilibacteria bacterium]